MTATITDGAGNVSTPSAATTITIDTIAPTTSAYTLDDTGSSSSDGITKNPVVGVTVEAGATWEYSVNGGTNWTAGSGNSFTLAEGVHAIGDIKVRQTDAAGNLQTTGIATNAAAITIDTVLPIISSGAAATTVSGVATSAVVYDANATDNGGSTDANVTYSLTGADAAKFTINAAGEVKFVTSPNHATPTDAGANNVYDINVVATDVAGNAKTQAVAITVDNAASVVTPDSATPTYVENAVGLLVNSGITITDVDSANLTGATVKISAATLTTGDALSFTSANGITGSYNSSTGVLTLSGSATVAQYQTALRSVKYSSTSDTPDSISATRTLEWQVNDGESLNNLSTLATSVVNVTAVNDLTQLDISGRVSGNFPAGMSTPFLSASPYDFNPSWSSVNTHIDFSTGASPAGAAQIEVDFAMADGYFGTKDDGNFSTPAVLNISAGGTVYAKVTGSTTGYANGTGMYTVTYLNGASGKLNGSVSATQGHMFFSANYSDNTQLLAGDQYLINATPWDNLLINLPAGASSNGALQFTMATTANFATTFSDEKVWFHDARVYSNTSVSHLNTILDYDEATSDYDYLSTFVMDYPAGAVDLTYTVGGVTTTVPLVTAGDASGWGWSLPFGTTIPKSPAATIEAHSTASHLGHYDFWTEDQGLVPVVADNMTITDIDGTMLTGGSVSIAHAELGDRLLINGVPVVNAASGTIGSTGVTYNATVTSGAVTITLSGSATHAAYINALKAISFDSTSQSLSGTVGNFTMDGSGNIVRNIAITLNDGDNSNTATNVIIVNNMNDQPSILAGQESIALPDVVKGTTTPIVYTVGDVFDNAFADVDAGDTIGGVMLTGNLSTLAQGTWQYHHAATGWSVIPTNLSNSNAMWLSADAQIRFKPNLSANATAVGALSGRIADSTVDYKEDGKRVSIDKLDPNGWAWDGATNALSKNTVTLTTNITPLAPVVLDLNRDGILTYSQSVMDINGDGKLDQTAWAGKDEGVLIWDKYADGQVHDNSQYAFAQYGGKTDLGGLAVKFDTNHDGKFNAQDAQFSQFNVWQDANQNGVSDAGEVYKLSDKGLISIDLTSDNIVRNPTGGVVEAGQGKADLADGSTMLLSDASFDFTTITDAYTLSLDSQLDLSITTAQPKSTSSLIKLDDVLQMPTVGSLIVDGQALDTTHFSPAFLTTNHDLMLKTTEELMQSAI